jgi:hypothetical protein
LLCGAVFDLDEMEIEQWMQSGQTALDGRRPSEMIDNGEGESVRRVLEGLLIRRSLGL